MPEAVAYIGNMFGVGSAGIGDIFFVETFKMAFATLCVGCVLSTPVFPKISEWLGKKKINLEQTMRAVICVLVFSLSLIQVVSSTYSPFIYFNF